MHIYSILQSAKVYFEKEGIWTFDPSMDVFHRCLIQSDYLNTSKIRL